MANFTVKQYEKAIADLQQAKKQTEDGNQFDGCSICGDAHPVYECGRNPLLAMEMCEAITKQSNELHETLHFLSGYDTFMGEQAGPAKIQLPDAE